MTAWHILAGAGLDLLIGDPRWFPHPVRGFGWVAERFERILRRTSIPARAAGAVYLLTLMIFACGLVYATLPWASIFWIWALLAIRDLDYEAALVLRALKGGDVELARSLAARIVGRDTSSLSEPEIVRAVVETVAENLNDAVVAPLFYLAIGGPAAMAGYKAVNTLDSMVGYRNERYREFGWASARLDDVLSWIPARLAAALVWLAAALLPGCDARNSIRITLRDAHTQPSPNSGYPEAAFAGALGVRLGGVNYYAGEPSRKAHLGDALRPLGASVFGGARRLLYGASALMILLAAGVRA